MFALPTASCGLRLEDEAVRVAVGLRLDLFVPHQCHCGSLLTPAGFILALFAKGKSAPGRSSRHHALNDLVVP